MTLAEVLKELRELDEKAMNGPWKHDTCGDVWTESVKRYDSQLGAEVFMDICSSRTYKGDPDYNIKLLCQTRNYLPGLLQVIEKQREALELIISEYSEHGPRVIASKAIAFDPFTQKTYDRT